MRFDEYFNFQDESIYGSGEFKESSKGTGKCSVCGNETIWKEIDLQVYVCSTECYDKLISNFLEEL